VGALPVGALPVGALPVPTPDSSSAILESERAQRYPSKRESGRRAPWSKPANERSGILRTALPQTAETQP
jgi:hypothetical protein